MKQQILFKTDKSNDTPYKIKLPKIIKHVSAFEMQFGFKQPHAYFCGKDKHIGEESKPIPGFTANVRI